MKKIGIFLRMDSMKKASEQELWYENIRYRFYPGLQVTFDKKTVQAYCKQLHLSVYFTLLFNLLDKYQIKVH